MYVSLWLPFKTSRKLKICGWWRLKLDLRTAGKDSKALVVFSKLWDSEDYICGGKMLASLM
jgi:hypothetical protein